VGLGSGLPGEGYIQVFSNTDESKGGGCGCNGGGEGERGVSGGVGGGGGVRGSGAVSRFIVLG